MSKSLINVLIVEDDLTLGKALLEGFKRSGYSAVLCTQSLEALSLALRTEFQVLFVDCMLPKMNGVDLVDEILKSIPARPKIFLTSGIFKDRNFVKESTERLNADGFFIKPFEFQDVLSLIDRSVSVPKEEQPSTPLLSLYAATKAEKSELIQWLNQEGTLHAFHLPKLYRRLLEVAATGELHLISADGSMSVVHFHNGQVFGVQTPDKDSYFGALAISQGFATPDDVLASLQDPEPKRLGQKLIGALSLSPHAVNVILEEQLALRLSQTVQNDVVSLQWIEKSFAKPEFKLSSNRFKHLVEDWLDSKITNEWIKSILLLWGPNEISGEFHSRIHDPYPIQVVFADSQFNEQRDLQPLFRALLNGTAFMSVRGEAGRDYTFLESRLDKMAKDYQDQNYFQFLSVGEKFHPRELNKSYKGLKESFDPANLPETCPPKIRKKAAKLFELIEQAHEVLADELKRNKYWNVLQNKRSQALFEAQPIFHAAGLELARGHAREAAAKLQDLIDRKLEFRDLKAYRIWAGLKLDRNYSDLRLDQVPPEERQTPAYMMARGVSFKAKNQFKKALECFQSANVLDPNLNIAKYELKELRLELEKNKSANKEMIREVTSIEANYFSRTGRRTA